MSESTMVIAEPKAAIKSINNISYMLNDFGIEFSFTYKCEGFKTAFLQLPNTPDSQHTIDNEDFDCDNEYHSEVFEALRDYFYADFKDVYCAKASAFLGKRINHVEEVDGVYVAFDTVESWDVLKEGGYSDYYNVFYFENYEMQDVDEKKLVETARKSWFSSLKSSLETALEKGVDAQGCDDIVNEFMNAEFGNDWNQDGDYSYAMDFYENIACDCRGDRQDEVAEFKGA